MTSALRAPRLDPTWAHPDDDPYAALALAILARAVQDATGHCSPTRGVPAAVLRAEARQWLQEEAALAELVELCGVDSAPVLRRVSQLLTQEPGRPARP